MVDATQMPSKCSVTSLGECPRLALLLRGKRLRGGTGMETLSGSAVSLVDSRYCGDQFIAL